MSSSNTFSRIFRKYFPTSGSRLLLFIFIFNFTTYNAWRDWKGEKYPFISDGDQYYSYIIATFLHHDPGFHFPNTYWLMPSPSGVNVPKVSIGLAYLMTPFFLIAHAVAYLGSYPCDGYSEPYAFTIYYSAILIVLLGLYYLRKMLMGYFSETVSNLTIVSVYFGTNLFYYTLGWNTIAHPYLFTLFVLFLYASLRWYKTQQWRYMAVLGFTFGLSVLIRPTEVVIGIIPLLYSIRSFKEFNARILFFWDQRIHLLIGVIFFLVPWIPQIVYWKYYTGMFFFYSYGEEGFYFFNPQFFNVLFSYRKGWLVYTPMMIFGIIGFYQMKKKCSDLFSGVLIVFILTLYLISAWWSWWWGGSFGMRALIHHYAFLAFPMASFYDSFLSKFKKWILYTIIGMMISYNLYQTYRYKSLVIHWDSMTKDAFWYGIFIINLNDDEKAELYKKLDPPDYSKKGSK